MSNVVFAISIGSQRVKAAAIRYAGRTRTEIYVEQENSNEAVRHGRIINKKKMAEIINKLILRLNNRAKIKGMRQAYVAIGGITMHSLKHQTKNPEMPGLWIVDTDQVGSDVYTHTTMDLKAFTAIEDSLGISKVKSIDMLTVPKATSTILTPEEKAEGCFLVDIGYGTTTIQIFSEGHLQHLAVIPIGGEAVTRDIMTYANISHDDAEIMKTTWSDASVNIDNVDENNGRTFEDSKLPIERKELNNIVVCRYEEIFNNIAEQIRISGINGFSIGVLTGGGSKQTGIETLTRRVLGMGGLAVQRRAFNEPCDIMSGKFYELTDIYGLASLCPAPDPTAANDTVETPASKHAEDTTPKVEDPTPHKTVTPQDKTVQANQNGKSGENPKPVEPANKETEEKKEEKETNFFKRIVTTLLSSNNSK